MVLKNPRGIQPYQVHSLKLKDGIEHAIDNDISILSMPETKLDWSQRTHKEQLFNIISPFYKHHKMITSPSINK